MWIGEIPIAGHWSAQAFAEMFVGKWELFVVLVFDARESEQALADVLACDIITVRLGPNLREICAPLNIAEFGKFCVNFREHRILEGGSIHRIRRDSDYPSLSSETFWASDPMSALIHAISCRCVCVCVRGSGTRWIVSGSEVQNDWGEKSCIKQRKISRLIIFPSGIAALCWMKNPKKDWRAVRP